jgi:S-formylglutathione hydrolase FrmB
MPQAPVPSIDPRVRFVSIPSPALGIPGRCYVYLPPDAEQSGQRLPVLFLLRGHEREWVNPHEDETRAGLTAIDVYERLRAAGVVGPLLMVMPGLASSDNHIPGMLTDFAAPERAGDRDGIGSGRFASYFFDDLLPYIDQHFPTIAGARALTGFSLGGMMALKAAAMHPELFGSVGCYDPTVFYAGDGGRSVRSSDTVLAMPMFDPALGVPRDYAHISANSPVNLLLQADRSALQRITWMVQYGSEQREPWGSNFYRGEYLLRVLKTLGISNALPPVLPDGGHTWATADRHLEQTLPLHWHALNRHREQA